MKEHYFLFFLLLAWTIFATIQDLKKREVANWLNFSLIAFALAYRASYSATAKDFQFFILGITGFAISFTLAYTFYYGKVFAGGDAKLLMGFGAALPFTSYFSLITTTLIFIASLLTFGAIYSLFFSIFIVAKNKTKFQKEFSSYLKKYKLSLTISSLLFFLLLLAGIENRFYWIISPLLLSPFLLIYAKSLETCMIVLLPPSRLTEGDWLEKEVTVGKTRIKKSVHGLSLKEIQLLKKHNKKVFIKQGIPFVPAFLLALLFMAPFFLTSKPALLSFLSSLFFPL